MSARLAVWVGDEQVGELDRAGRRFQIRFTARPDASALLTVAPEGADATWTPAFTRAWFDNLLPEEGRRAVAEAEHQVERGDTFGLLAAIGWECAGAVPGGVPGCRASLDRTRTLSPRRARSPSNSMS
ncbi:MAG: HipA N-terminal domain-containing protein [Chloroflexota bacterium]